MINERGTTTIHDDHNASLTVLIVRCASGDPDAFSELYRLESSRLYGLALRITKDGPLAADAVHDTFASIWKHAGRFNPARGLAGAWLTSIVRYRAIDGARRQSREQPGHQLQDEEDGSPNALTQLVNNAEIAALRQCLGELQTDRRTLLMSAYIDGLSHNELSKRSGTPLGTIKSRIRRSLASLRECLAG